VASLKNPSDALSDIPGSSRRREHKEAQRQTRRVQIGIPISGDPRPRTGRTSPPFGCFGIPAIVVGAIGPCTGSGTTWTPGTGAAQLYYMDVDNTRTTADSDNTSVTVLNWFQNTGTIAVNKHVFVVLWSQNYWLVATDC
jgi:hypothetical protein